MDAVVERPATRAPGPASLRDAFSVWGQISIAGIGGAALQLATMHRLLVQGKRWISEDRFFHALSYCIAMPGPETQQLSIYIGWLTNRTLGGVIAGGLFVLPGVVCMMALTFGYVTGGDSPFGHAISLGIRPAILAVMAEGILRFGRHVLHSPSMAVLAVASFIAAFIRVPFPIIMTTAGLIGAIAVLTRLPRPGAARPGCEIRPGRSGRAPRIARTRQAKSQAIHCLADVLAGAVADAADHAIGHVRPAQHLHADFAAVRQSRPDGGRRRLRRRRLRDRTGRHLLSLAHRPARSRKASRWARWCRARS